MMNNIPDSIIEYIYEYFSGIDIYNFRITNKCNINKKDVLNKYIQSWNRLPLNFKLLKIVNIAKKIENCQLIFIEDSQDIYDDFSINYETLYNPFFVSEINKINKDLSLLAFDELGRPIRLDKNMNDNHIGSIHINIFNKQSKILNQILYHKYEEKYSSLTLIRPKRISKHWISYSSKNPIINNKKLKIIFKLSMVI